MYVCLYVYTYMPIVYLISEAKPLFFISSSGMSSAEWGYFSEFKHIVRIDVQKPPNGM